MAPRRRRSRLGTENGLLRSGKESDVERSKVPLPGLRSCPGRKIRRALYGGAVGRPAPSGTWHGGAMEARRRMKTDGPPMRRRRQAASGKRKAESGKRKVESG